MFGADSTGTGEGGDSGSGVRQANELRALSALVFEDLRAFPGGIRDRTRVLLGVRSGVWVRRAVRYRSSTTRFRAAPMTRSGPARRCWDGPSMGPWSSGESGRRSCSRPRAAVAPWSLH